MRYANVQELLLSNAFTIDWLTCNNEEQCFLHGPCQGVVNGTCLELGQMNRLQNRLLHAIGNLDRSTLVRDLHLAFRILYVYDYITKLCRRQAEVILFSLLAFVKKETECPEWLNLLTLQIKEEANGHRTAVGITCVSTAVLQQHCRLQWGIVQTLQFKIVLRLIV
jgi:hypothetical protein